MALVRAVLHFESRGQGMKQYTDEEIVAKCEELWPNAEAYNWGGETPAIQVQREGDAVKIIVGAMYGWDDEFPILTMDKRIALSEFFDTMMVEDTREFESAYGCETCEYGGAHGFVARIAPGAPFDPEIAESIRSAGSET